MRTEPWPVSDTERSEILRALRFDYFKWDVFAVGKCLVLPESMILTQAEHERAVGIVERFASILDGLEARLRDDPHAMRFLGIPETLIPIIQAEPPRELQIARYDLFPTDDGRWMVSEFNEDVPGGFNEAVGLPRLLGPFLESGTNFRGDLGASFVEAFARWDAVAFLFATGYSEDLEHMLILERLLKEAGHETGLASPAHLRKTWRGRAEILGRSYDAGFRFYPGEWIPRLPNCRTWRTLADRFPVMNPLRRLIRQSKRLFILWHEAGLLTADDADFVRAHAPESVAFDAARIPEWEAGRVDWVIKHAFGRMGDSVVMGCLDRPETWMQALHEVSKSPGDYLMQRCFRNTTLEFQAGPLYPAIGGFLVNGRFAGYYSRAAPEPFLTHEAYHVTTLVENPA